MEERERKWVKGGWGVRDDHEVEHMICKIYCMAYMNSQVQTDV